jgi:hypothetical protein
MKALVVALIVLLAASLTVNLYLAVRLGSGEPVGQKVTVWNVPATIKPHSYLFSSMFDTFKMQVQLDSNSSVYVYVFTPTEYVDFQENSANAQKWEARFSGNIIDFNWNLSTGCAGYVWVVYNPSLQTVLVKPYVTAVYDPAQNPTGVCAAT